MVGRYFLWPGMIKDVLVHCSSCSVCQLRSKHRPRKAPVVERPILTEPFESVAVDLVGPLPKGKRGHQYILTYVCLATKWPEAVPLRRVTARVVAEGLWSIFSRTAIPERLLSDQGSQFCGKVVKELCGLLCIQKLRTSPYHPEMNGAVERMHGTFKSILGKCIAEGLDWVGQVCFVLFVLRQMPNSDSGFSPFDMVFGFRVRTPLHALYHGFYEMEGREMGVCEWVNGLAERLDLMRDCAALKLGKSRESRLKYVNRGSKSRELEEGSLVLYRVPGMSSKLADSWEGPYKVLAKKGAVNYKIGKVGAETHAKVVHINCLKQYVERRTVNRLDVVLEEHVTATKVLSGMCDGFVQEELDELLSEYGEVFSDRPGGIRDAVKKELEELEESGIIERSSSPWSSPLVPVRKPDGGVRLCVDYRKLNAITTREPYCMPTLEEMLERVGTGCVLSKVDLAKGFHQVAVDPEHKEKTCFTCPFGKFQYCRMPFGLTNAPAIFQRLMDEVLVNCSDFTNVYIDDILVVSRSWGVHLEHLRELFRTLKEAGLTCMIGKCEFGRKKMMFLGHEIGEGAICVPEARVQALREHPRPKTRRQLRAYLGLVGYYRRFIAGFHRWFSLLTPHTAAKGNERVEWTDPMLVAFSELCNVLSNSVCLCVPQECDVFCLECDASGTGVGAVLSVERDGELLPVAFFSRQLRGAQYRYSAQELECLAAVEAVKHFSYYLYGRYFRLLTDHKGLESLRSGKQLNRRVYGWSLMLSEFDFTVMYRCGRDNIVADELSRCHAGNCGEATRLLEEGGDVGLGANAKAHMSKEQREEKEDEDAGAE